ncbi:hypothetical protein Tco_0132624 [Tanacetum coccineum]
MNTTQAQQKALDDALVAPADRLEFRKCNMRLKTDIKPKEATFQVVLDALALTLFYRAFLITADVPAIYIYINHGEHLLPSSTSVKWQREWNRQDSSVPCSDPLGHEDTQAYGTILLKELTNQAMLESNVYKTYYAFASGEKAPKPKYSKAKVAKPDKKKQPAKKPKAKGLAILFEVELSEAEQLKLATKRSKTQFHSSHASGSGDGVNTQSKVPDKQQQKTSSTDEGTGTIPGGPDVPIYESKSEKESWGDSEDEDDENNSDDLSDKGDDDNDGNDGNDDDDDANDDDKQEGDDTNDVDEETDSDRTESDRIKIPVLDQSTTEFYEEEEEYDDESNIKEDEKMDEEEDNEVTKDLFKDVNIDADYDQVDQGASEQTKCVSRSGFEQ